MKSQPITAKERAFLGSIVNSEYQDDPENPVGHQVWLDYLADSKSLGGVLTSLQAKGLVGVSIIPMAKSDNAVNGISDSTVWVTEAGFKAFRAAKG